MAKSAKATQQAVRSIVDNFDIDGSTDYARMDTMIQDELGIRLDNKSLWALINKASSNPIERVSFSLDD